MPITYDPDTNTITVVGTKDGNPWTFEDIYQADVNNGWGVVEKIGRKSYYIKAFIVIGDGETETWFKDYEFNVEFDGSIVTAENRELIHVKSNANLILGNPTSDLGLNGKILVTSLNTWSRIQVDGGAVAKYYNIAFESDSYELMVCVRDGEAINCHFTGMADFGTIVNSVIKYCVITNAPFPFQIGDSVSVYENLTVFNAGTVARAYNANAILKNVIVVEYCNNIFYMYNTSGEYRYARLIDCISPKWDLKIYSGTAESVIEIFRQYIIRIKVTDKDGNPLSTRTVEIYDKNGLQVSGITDSNGYVELTLTYAKWRIPDEWIGDATFHTVTEDEWDYLAPFTLKVWKGKELEYEAKLDENVIINPPVYLQIVVSPSSKTIDDVYDAVDLVRKLIGNRWKIENNQLLIFDDDNQTVIRRFKLYDKQGNPSEIEIYDRIPEE